MYSPKDAFMKREESKRNKGNLLEKDMVLCNGCSLANRDIFSCEKNGFCVCNEKKKMKK